MSKILNSLKMINTRIMVHCAAVIAATFLVSWFQIKPYGVLFLTLLVFWVYKTRCAASIQIIPPPELNAKILSIYDKLLELRKDRPTIFCAIITSVLAVLAIIGHLLSGSNVVVVGLILSALISTKYNFKILKVPNKERLSWVDLADNDVDEFLPEENDSNLFVLQRASDQAIIPTGGSPTNNNNGVGSSNDEDEKNDEIPSELLLPDSIPEIDENSESSDDELIPKLPASGKLQNNFRQQNDNGGNDDDNDEKSLEFKRGYFKKDSSISTSSSSDDESLSKGLNFHDYTVVDGRDRESQKHKNQQQQQQQQQSMLLAASAAALLPNLMTGIMSSLSKSANSSPPQMTTAAASSSSTAKPLSSNKDKLQQLAVDTSDESDFEILNTDDLNHP